MLYLPRLFVYHCEAEPGSKQSETFKVMERRLLKAIINPAMIATWIFGLCAGLARAAGTRRPGCRASSLLVIALSALHGLLFVGLRISPRTAIGTVQKFYRLINEVPAVLMVLIVILVVVKPF